MRVDVDPFRHRVKINKGADDGVFKNQPVLDAFGIVGQVVQVDKYTATIILISDAEHAIPVQVNRNGIRSIAVGAGDLSRLTLPYLTVESDVKSGDLLVSSGLDGIFPAGYPVAKVTKVERNPAETFALVEAKPLAQLDRDREVLLLWTDTPAQLEAPASTSKPSAKKPSAATTESAPAAETPARTPAQPTPSTRPPAATAPSTPAQTSSPAPEPAKPPQPRQPPQA
jgi:rod shape-determining protein MreC